MIYDDLKLCHIWIKWLFSIIELMLNNIVYIPSKLGPLWYFLVTLFVYRNIKPINLKHVFSKNEKKKKKGRRETRLGGWRDTTMFLELNLQISLNLFKLFRNQSLK